MISDDPVVAVHSVAEAFLYLMLCRCGACDRGPLKPAGDLVKRRGAAGGWQLTAQCPACQARRDFDFAIDPPPTREQAASKILNPTNDPSRAIDLLGWLTLFRTILNASQEASDKSTMRQLVQEAAACLDEAMKFYGPDDELPPPDAFFTRASRRRFDSHPFFFARSAGRERRLKRPADAATAVEPSGNRRRRGWLGPGEKRN